MARRVRYPTYDRRIAGRASQIPLEGSDLTRDAFWTGSSSQRISMPLANMAAATGRLLADPELRKHYAAAGTERVRTFCAPEVLARKVEDVYRAAMARVT